MGEAPRCAICGRPAWGYNKAIDESNPSEKVWVEELWVKKMEMGLENKDELEKYLKSRGVLFSKIREDKKWEAENESAFGDKEVFYWVIEGFEGFLCIEHWPKCEADPPPSFWPPIW